MATRADNRVELVVRPGRHRRRIPDPSLVHDENFHYYKTPPRAPTRLLAEVDGLAQIMTEPPTGGSHWREGSFKLSKQRERHLRSFLRHFGGEVEPLVAALIDEQGWRAVDHKFEVRQRFIEEHPDKYVHFERLFRHGTIRGSTVPENAFGYVVDNAQMLCWGGWPLPDYSTCRMCAHEFLPKPHRGLPESLDVVGQFCNVCIGRVYRAEIKTMTDRALARRMCSISDALGYAPTPNVAWRTTLTGVDPARVDTTVAALMAMPDPYCLLERYGRPWTRVLLKTGVFEDVRPTGRGTMSVARDGHFCRSLGERAIDDFFDSRGIRHTPEPPWPMHKTYNPTGLRRADWKLDDGTYVEYAGLAGEAAYDRKIADKRALAAATDTQLIVIGHSQLTSLDSVFADRIPRGG